MKVTRKLIAIVASVCIATVFSVIPMADPAHANDWGAVKYAKKITIIKDSGGSQDLIINMGSKAKKAKKITVSSSNTKIASGWKKGWTPLPKGYAGYTVKKAGTATLTIKIKFKNGKTKKYKTKLTAVAYKNPLQTLKVGDLDLTAAFDKEEFGDYKLDSDVTGALAIAARDGWSIDKITYEQYYVGDDEDADYEDIEKTVQDGNVITLVATGEEAEWETKMTIELRNSTNGLKQELRLTPYYD